LSAPALGDHLHRVRRWLSEPTNRGVVRAAIVVALLSIVGNVAALLRDAVVARRFGLGDQLDAYLTALLLPTVGIGVISGSLTVALLPVYVRVREREGHAAASELIARSLGRAMTTLVLVALGLAVVSPVILPWLAPGFPPAKLLLVRQLLYLLLPSLVLSGMAALWTAVLNAGERFVMAALAPIAVPLSTLAAIVAFPRFGVHALAAGTTVGFGVVAVLVGTTLWNGGLSPLPRFRGMTPAVQSVFDEYWPMVIGALFMSGTNLVDQAMAAMLGAGSVSALSLGGKLTSAAAGIASVAVGAAVFPPLSRWVASEDWRGLARGYRQYTLLVLALGVVAAGTLTLGARSLVDVVFAGRAFGEDEVLRVAAVQRFLAWQLPCAAAGLIGARLLSALGRNRVLMLIAGVNLLVNAAGNLVLMRTFGLAGIALATSVTYLISFAAITVAVQRELGRRALAVARPSIAPSLSSVS
jgi:putative peptidoglycan lipid II flippase